MKGKRRSLLETAEQGVLVQWFGHIKRMEEEKMIKSKYRSIAEGERLRVRPRKGWRNGVQKVSSHLGLSIKEGMGHSELEQCGI